jgi:hypothetical protein
MAKSGRAPRSAHLSGTIPIRLLYPESDDQPSQLKNVAMGHKETHAPQQMTSEKSKEAAN